MNYLPLPDEELELIEAADLKYCAECCQLTLQTVDQVLDVYTSSSISEVMVRCLRCETTAIVLVPHEPAVVEV